MAVDSLKVGHKKFIFRGTVVDSAGAARDISTATTMQFIFQKPVAGDDLVTVTASFYTDGIDGILQYVTPTTTFLDQSGIWSLEAHIILTDGEDFTTKRYKFRVESNLS